MTDIGKRTVNPFSAQEGDRVEIHSPGYPPCHGIVEDSQPALDVVWIRDCGTGERKMLSIADHHLHCV